MSSPGRCRRALALACLVAALAGAAGCGASFSLVRESASDATLFGTAGTVFVAPLQFLVPPEASPEEWAAYVGVWDEAYSVALVTELRDMGVASVQRLNPGEAALEGTSIQTSVREIRRGYSVGLGEDRLVAQVQFVDATSGQSRVHAEIEVGSSTAGSQRSFLAGRIRMAAIKLAYAVAEGRHLRAPSSPIAGSARRPGTT